MPAFDDPSWVMSMLGLCALHEREAAVPRRGSLWASRSTGRRGHVLWVIHGEVCMEWREGVSSQYQLADFLRLYREV